MRTCAVPSCDRRHEARGLCKTHYRRLMRSDRLRSDLPIQVVVGDWPGRLICTVPGHQHSHDHLGACVVCGVPTVVGLHPNARAALFAKRPDLAHLAS